MNCPKCGWNNPDNAAKCANCFAELTSSQPQPTQQMPPQQPGQQPYVQQQQYGQQPYAQQQVQAVQDHLVWSILVTLFCCVPFGIIAIVKSAAANSKKSVGDYYGALQDANAAKTWIWWGFGVGLAVNLIWVTFYIIGIVATMGHHRGF